MPTRRPRPSFLVTAGNTREPIDSVRDWGNVFTGNTGLGIAKALSGVGDVELLTSNLTHVDEVNRAGESRLRAVAFRSHADLRGLLESRFATSHRAVHPDGVFMTAAVADYRPERSYEVVSRETAADGTEHWVVRDAQAAKVKSSFVEMAVLGRRTEKLVDLFRKAWGFRGLLVKFKLEAGLSAERLIEVASASRHASDADFVVANTLEMVGSTTHGGGFGRGAFLLGTAAPEWVPRDELAERLARLAADHVASQTQAFKAG